MQTTETVDWLLAENQRLRAQLAEREAQSIEASLPWFEHVNDAIFVTDAAWTILQWNSAAETLYGWLAGEAVGRPIWEVIPVVRYHGGESNAGATSALLRERIWRGTFVQHTRDGRELVIEGSTRAIVDAQASITGYIGINRDITAREQAEQALKASEAQYSTLFATMVQGVVYHAADGRIIACNPAAERILGLTLEQMQGRTSMDPRWRAIHEDGSDFPGETHPAMVALYTGKPVQNVVMGVYNWEQDSYRWIQVSAVPQIFAGEQDSTLVYATFDDITARIQAEQALKASEVRFATAFRLSPAPMVISRESDGCLLDVTESFLALYGGTRAELIGASWHTLVLFPDHTAITKFEEQLRAQHRLTHQELTIRARTGVLHTVLLSSEAIMIDATACFITVLYDITEQRQAEAAYQTTERKLSAILDLLPVGVAILGADRALIYSNPALERILELPHNQIADGSYTTRTYLRSDGSLMPTDEFASARAFQEQQVVTDVETGIRLEDGRQIWTSVSATPIALPDWSIVTVTSDITERKRAEAARQGAAERLQVLSDASHIFAAAGVNEQVVLQQIAAFIAKQLDGGCVIRLLSEDGKWLEANTFYDRDSAIEASTHALVVEERIQIDSANPAAAVFRSGRGLLMATIDRAAIRASVPPALWQMLEQNQTHSAVIVPLQMRGQPIGTMSFARYDLALPAFTEDDLRLAQDLADRAALAIANARLFGQLQTELDARARAQAELHASEETLRIVTETAGIGLALVDADYRYRYLNQTHKDYLGLPDSDLVQVPVADVFGASYEPLVRQRLERAFRGESVSATLDLPITPHTEQRHYEVRITPAVHSVRPLVVVVLIDITSRMQAEQEVRDQARVLELTQALVLGLDGQIALWTTGAERLYGYSKTEALGQISHTLLRTQFPQSLNHMIEQLYRRGRWSGTLVHQTRSGQSVTVASEWVLDRSPDGQPRRIIEVNTDITARVQAEQTTQRTAERLATLRAIDQAILEAHAPATIANTVLTRLQALLGCPHASVMLYDEHRAVRQLFTDNNALAAALPLGRRLSPATHAQWEHFQRGEPWLDNDVAPVAYDEPKASLIVANQVRSLLHIPLLVQWQVIGTLNLAAGTPNAFTSEHVSIAQEIGNTLAIALHNTQLVESLQLELAARERAEQALIAEHARVLQLKNEFMATMSHELRTPLSAVLGHTELLLEQIYGPLTPRQQAALERITSSGQNLLALINDILDYTKFESGSIALATGPADVQEICSSSVRLIEPAARAKRITLTTQHDPAVRRMIVDGQRLQQMLVNLLSNAVKFSQAGDAVEFAVCGDAAQQQVVFSVRDTGIGIAAEDLGRLFQPFTQLDSKLSRQYEGTGLGLALVRRIAEAHGGSVGVTSAPGQGSTFSITLPWQPILQEAGEQHSEHQAAADTAAQPGLPTILLVEDSASNIAVLRDMLDIRGYPLLLARDASEGLAIARQQRPALILMDIQLPGMSGLEAIQQIRADSELKQLPVIALTALVLPGDRERCLAAGANEYLAKPVSARTLLNAIERHTRNTQ